jgi:hypothetical protein
VYVVMWLSENQKDENLNENLFEIGACKYIYHYWNYWWNIFVNKGHSMLREIRREKRLSLIHWWFVFCKFWKQGFYICIRIGHQWIQFKSMQKRTKCKPKQNDWMVNRQSSKNVKIGTGMIKSSEKGNLGARLVSKGC